MDKKRIQYRVQKQVLHIIFPPSKGISWNERHSQFIHDQYHPEDVYQNPLLCNDVKRASARYEGENEFVGFNFPSSFVKKEDTVLFSLLQRTPIRYVIAYMDGDEPTKQHEKRHSKFYIEPEYKKRVTRSWKKLRATNPKKFKSIRKKLRNNGYRPKVFIDEFQAYHPELIV